LQVGRDAAGSCRTQGGAWLDADDLLAFASRRLARFELPNSVAVVELLPRTGAGKVGKELLRKVQGEP
jgi:acyl-CoA synthetase (AMP-forming)/AMP-acid ligase II